MYRLSRVSMIVATYRCVEQQVELEEIDGHYPRGCRFTSISKPIEFMYRCSFPSQIVPNIHPIMVFCFMRRNSSKTKFILQMHRTISGASEICSRCISNSFKYL